MNIKTCLLLSFCCTWFAPIRTVAADSSAKPAAAMVNRIASELSRKVGSDQRALDCIRKLKEEILSDQVAMQRLTEEINKAKGEKGGMDELIEKQGSWRARDADELRRRLNGEPNSLPWPFNLIDALPWPFKRPVFKQESNAKQTGQDPQPSGSEEVKPHRLPWPFKRPKFELERNAKSTGQDPQPSRLEKVKPGESREAVRPTEREQIDAGEGGRR